jgi:hypothetical protein
MEDIGIVKGKVEEESKIRRKKKKEKMSRGEKRK